jgi:hypothetical protein
MLVRPGEMSTSGRSPMDRRGRSLAPIRACYRFARGKLTPIGVRYAAVRTTPTTGITEQRTSKRPTSAHPSR